MATLRPPRLLVVDDRRHRSEFLCALLRSHGFETASTAQSARAIESVRDEGVAVLLVSRDDAHGDAARFISEVRSRPEPSVHDVAIVALVDEPWSAERMATAGADAVLVRPVHAARLVAIISRVGATRPATRVARRAVT